MTGNPSVETEFSRTLQRLKRRGCNLLLVGSVPNSVLRAASRKLLGDDEEDRYRVVVLAGMTRAAGGRLSRDVADETAQVIRHDPTARSSNEDVPAVSVDDDIGDLCVAISETITRFADESDGFSPGELRVCLDSLDALLGRYDRAVVRQLVGIVAGQIRGAKGMGHFVLPFERDSEVVADFAPLFDAVIEYRVAEGGQERWHFTQRDLRSPWLPV